MDVLLRLIHATRGFDVWHVPTARAGFEARRAVACAATLARHQAHYARSIKLVEEQIGILLQAGAGDDDLVPLWELRARDLCLQDRDLVLCCVHLEPVGEA